MKPGKAPEAPPPTSGESPSPQRKGLSSHLGRLRSFFADRRISLSGLLLFAYAAGIVSAFYIRDSHPVAVVYPGPYALVAIYQGNVYELVPMEDSVRQRHTDADKKKSEMEKIGKVEAHKPVSATSPIDRQGEPHKQNPWPSSPN